MAYGVSEILKKYSVNPKVSEILKKIGRPFPLMGAHYYYVDMVEHMRHALTIVKECSVDNLVERHLPEIYKRREQLLGELHKAKVLLREDEYNLVYDELTKIFDQWTNDFKKYLDRCFR